MTAVGGVFHAAQTSAQTASHHVFERHLAVDALALGNGSHGFHHGLRTAASDVVDGEIEDGMLGNESLFALRTVFGGDIHLAPTLKLVEQQQVGGRACAKQKSHLFAKFREHFAQLEQWSDAHAATYEHHFASERATEAVAKRHHKVECFAHSCCQKRCCALASLAYEQLELISLFIYIADGDRAAEESGF